MKLKLVLFIHNDFTPVKETSVVVVIYLAIIYLSMEHAFIQPLYERDDSAESGSVR